MESRANIYEICKNIEETIGVRALTLEFEILLELYFSGDLSAGEVFSRVHASQASFSSIARRMLDEGLLVSSPGHPDRRRTIYSISDKARQMIAACVRDVELTG